MVDATRTASSMHSVGCSRGPSSTSSPRSSETTRITTSSGRTTSPTTAPVRSDRQSPAARFRTVSSPSRRRRTCPSKSTSSPAWSTTNSQRSPTFLPHRSWLPGPRLPGWDGQSDLRAAGDARRAHRVARGCSRRSDRERRPSGWADEGGLHLEFMGGSEFVEDLTSESIGNIRDEIDLDEFRN